MKKVGLLLLFLLIYHFSFSQFKALTVKVNNLESIYSISTAIHVNNSDYVTIEFHFADLKELKQFSDTLMVKGCSKRQNQQLQTQQQQHTSFQFPSMSLKGRFDKSSYFLRAGVDANKLIKYYSFRMSEDKHCQGEYYPVFLIKNGKVLSNIELPNFYLVM